MCSASDVYCGAAAAGAATILVMRVAIAYVQHCLPLHQKDYILAVAVFSDVALPENVLLDIKRAREICMGIVETQKHGQ